MTRLEDLLRDEETVSARVRLLLEETGLTQHDLAGRLGTSRTRVNAWAKGRSAIGRDYAAKLGDEFDISAELFLAREAATRDEALQEIREEVAEVRGLVVQLLEAHGLESEPAQQADEAL